MKDKVMGELKKTFRPEFLNRIDGTVVFHALNKEHILKIVDLMFAETKKHLDEKGLKLKITAAAKDYLASHGYDPALGARPLRRVIQDQVEDQLSEGLLKGDFQPGDTVKVDCVDDKITLNSAAAVAKS
jgi:ATP-dependent Clp protease ATP-binding subunit ClpC